MKSLILVTVVFSVIVAIFPAISCLRAKKNIIEIFDEFIYSFLGGLLGGFIGTIIGFIAGYIYYRVSFFQPNFGFPDLSMMFVWLAGLGAGVLIGGIITIKPIIKLFLNS